MMTERVGTVLFYIVPMSSLTLFIDLCSHKKIIACVDDQETLACAEIPDHTDEADLMPAIERLLLSAAAEETILRSSSITRIAVITGPGGFMSQRVAMSLANTLSWSLKIPIAGIHLSDLWAARISKPSSLTLNPFLWLHSTQKKSLFIRGFDALEKKWPEATLISLDDAKIQIPKESLFIGELIPEHSLGLAVQPYEKLRMIEEVLPDLCGKFIYGKPPVLPWYGRGV